MVAEQHHVLAPEIPSWPQFPLLKSYRGRPPLKLRATLYTARSLPVSPGTVCSNKATATCLGVYSGTRSPLFPLLEDGAACRFSVWIATVMNVDNEISRTQASERGVQRRRRYAGAVYKTGERVNDIAAGTALSSLDICQLALQIGRAHV